ncbi:putative toxin-antitoxin system toxin component, PIN family [Candidatus Woesearchaeota archaeon]|nr:putative toxin-antitoxin system toxin component, PIN family [Candidatus Woesearchaeota archaeon]
MRIVLDTNVFISGIHWNGNYCSQIIEKWKSQEFELIISTAIIDEIITTLKTFKIPAPASKIHVWQKMLERNSIPVVPTFKVDVIKDDPSDNIFLEAAVAGRAEVIVSQDKHLLKLKEFRKIRILTPKKFLENMF